MKILEIAYKSLKKIRRTEEKIVEIYATDKIKSPVHLSIGQEFVAVGVCDALARDDVAFGTYRSHALYLAKGGDLKAMWAELYGKRDGCARGKGGSMHLLDTTVNVMGTSAIVATSLPNAVGYALAEKMRGTGRVVVVFFGEGATDEGAFHESMNFAALKKVPLLFVCENNGYAIYSHVGSRMPEVNLLERAAAYRVPGRRLDDGRYVSVRDAARESVARIRAGGGPEFLEVAAYRWRDHVGPGMDGHLEYRPPEELAAWMKADELVMLGRELSDEARARIDGEVEAELADAIAFAEASAFPDDEEALHNVFA